MHSNIKVLCEACQRKIRETWLENHMQSSPHLRAVQIAALLDKRSMSFAEIAREVGVSRERIRRFAAQRGYVYPKDLTEEITAPKGTKEYYRQCGRLGGTCRSKRKTRASRRNLKKALRLRKALDKGTGRKS